MKQPRSEAQIAASRANGAKSSGPATPEGKAVSKLNALTHGAHAVALLLPGEDEEELLELRRSYANEFYPRTASEKALVENLLAARWRILRLLRFEQQNPPESLEDMDRSSRLHARLQRQHETALRLLRAVRPNEPEPAVTRAESKPPADKPDYTTPSLTEDWRRRQACYDYVNSQRRRE